MSKTVRIGTRGSALAQWQANHIRDKLLAAHDDLTVEIEIISTKGDQIIDKPLPSIGGKGLFTAELEAALREKTIDLAVHSLKDLPTESPEGLVIVAVPERGSPRDVLVSRKNFTFEKLPQGAIIGTSSTRRAAQLLHRRPDIEIKDIRGNVPTRIDKALDAEQGYDAIVLAEAGLQRLKRSDDATEVIDYEVMLPAPGQGALGVQSRDDAESRDLLASIDHAPTRAAVTAERAFLAALGGGCSLPIAARAYIENDKLHFAGRVNSPDGSRMIEVSDTYPVADYTDAQLVSVGTEVGLGAAQDARQRGALFLLGTTQHDQS